MPHSATKKLATAADYARVDFEPCDREKYPIVSEKIFMANMERVAKVAYAAHVAAYFSKTRMIEILRGFEGQEAPTMMDDFKEVRGEISELCRTIEAIKMRFLVAGACLEVADAA